MAVSRMRSNNQQIGRLIFLLPLFFMASCGNQENAAGLAKKSFTLNLAPAFPKLTFDRPVDLQSPSDGSNRIFVVQQPGIISVFDNSSTVNKAEIFLDITAKVFMGHMEEGLLGLAFHPHFHDNGFFYVNYTANPPRRTVIARFQIDNKNPTWADPLNQLTILEIPQPFGNHKGGQLAFGPDGYLYIGMGDGGSGGDPYGNAQNLKNLLGKMLRLDVDHPGHGKNYGIPEDNPFAGNTQGFREEIYAYGLRNPWRFSFDLLTGWLWAGDVGQNKPIEEIDIIENGKNYGWNIMEGNQCFFPPDGCDKTGIELPIWEYTNDMGRSITGGYVYRGRNIPELQGAYIYGDFMSGRIWALRYDKKSPPENTLLIHAPQLNPASFGMDQENEIYICSFDGHIYKIEMLK